MGVVRVVGPGVVLEDVHGAAADLADAPPVEIAEVDQQVGWDAAALGVELLGPVRDRADRPAVLVPERLELLLQLVADALVVGVRTTTPCGSRPATLRNSRQ